MYLVICCKFCLTFLFSFIPGLYHGIRSRSCKVKRGERRTSEKTGNFGYCHMSHTDAGTHVYINLQLKFTHIKSSLIDIYLGTAGRNYGNSEKSSKLGLCFVSFLYSIPFSPFYFSSVIAKYLAQTLIIYKCVLFIGSRTVTLCTIS